jgi:predicted alpha/beta hydrolase family esterase
MKILYLHGKGSKPHGIKTKYLESLGYAVSGPNLPDESFSKSVLIAKDHIKKQNPDLIVASSRGGAVALAAADQNTNMVLICPAWKHFNVTLPKTLENVIVLHSKADEIVSWSDSQFLSTSLGALLITCGENHRMIDKEALTVLEGVLL